MVKILRICLENYTGLTRIANALRQRRAPYGRKFSPQGQVVTARSFYNGGRIFNAYTVDRGLPWTVIARL